MVSGQRIRLRGQGIGGGDLYLKIMVEPHPCFQLQGADIVCRLPLTPSEATLGGTMTVPTLDGPVQMTIPAGVQPGQKLRLAGKGYPLNLEGRGDQIVEIAIAIPTVLDPEEKNLYQALRSIERFNPRADLPS
jgi:curved DNA-binding protein